MEQIVRSRDIFKAFGIPIYELAGYEADDIIDEKARHTDNRSESNHRRLAPLWQVRSAPPGRFWPHRYGRPFGLRRLWAVWKIGDPPPPCRLGPSKQLSQRPRYENYRTNYRICFFK
ncbi:MAG: hypothetical protein DSY40_02515 [Nautilia sp.]|nr:MAG: hypothetical protein DSY40_02515 [Nautilia sp.]